jgi:hypothetical protein
LRTSIHAVSALVLLAAAVLVGCAAGPDASPAPDAGDGGGDAAVDLVTADGGAPGPELLGLAVAPGPLQPAFAPHVYDYAVACSAATNAWSVTATARPGTRVTVQGAPSNGAPVEQAVAANEAVVVRVEAASASAEYWIRCLPPDFPAIVATKAGPTTPGYYLVGNALAANGYGPYAMILDANGTPVWYHHGKPGLGILNVDSPTAGVVSWMNGLGPFGRDPAGAYDVHVLEPWSSTQVKAFGTPTDPHELVSLPNGHHYVLSYPPRVGVDLTGLASLGPSETIADCEVQELDEAGQLVWDWFASDHLDPAKEATDYGTTWVGNVAYQDVFHCNSIDVDADGNLLVSARHLDAVFSIDRATGKLRWKLGGTPWNKEGALVLSFVDETQAGFFHQHDARFLPDGHLTLFDNHGSQLGVARCVEYEIDTTNATATLRWEVRDTQPSDAMGSCRRQPDGNTVVAWGWPANGYGHVLTEFGPTGAVLFDVAYGKNNLSYRAIKVAPSQFDVGVLRATAGRP